MGDVFIQINQITVQIYVRSYDISVINPFIEENLFLRMFHLTCISLFRALCICNSDHFRLQLNQYKYTPCIGTQKFLLRI